MKDIITLGIETSCDETSSSVIKNGREVLSNIINSQIDIHEVYRRCGSRNRIKSTY
jgi:N6-L-threonylcarbamoyladenine synthase